MFQPAKSSSKEASDATDAVVIATLARQEWLGVGVPICETVHQGPTGAVGVGSFAAYPACFEFTLSVRTVAKISPAFGGLIGVPPPAWRRAARSGSLPDELFRLGIWFCDGSLAVETHNGVVGTVRGAPRLTKQEAQGSERSIDVRYVVSGAATLRGRARVVIEWPAHRIPLEAATLPLRDIASASEVAKRLRIEPPASPAEGVGADRAGRAR